MVLDEIKARMFRAMKAGQTVEKEILRVAVGEITTDAARPGKKGDDEEAFAILRKLIKSNEESLGSVGDPEREQVLKQEIAVLADLLPRSLGEEEVAAALAPVVDALRAAKSDGQATGIAMKHLKTAGAIVDGKVVTVAVQRLRAP
jgi:uncharacterized protein YqeY